jgi:putative membrane protein
MKFLSQVLLIARIESHFLWRYPKMLLVMAVVITVPTLYALIYLSSVWDPDSHTRALTVAVVDLDNGTAVNGKFVNLGRDVVSRLTEQGRFGFQLFADEAAARSVVRRGDAAFALIIPENFSVAALAGNEAGAARPVVFASEGNNYEGAAIARRFAESLDQEINKNLNAQRWKTVLATAAQMQGQVQDLHRGVEQLRQGAEQLSHGARQTAAGARTLADGNSQMHAGVAQLTSGVKEISSGLQSAGQSLPAANDLNRLKTGAQTLAAGQTAVVKGMGELKSGMSTLDTGISSFREQARDSLFMPSSVVAGSDQLADGVSRLNTGLESAWSAQQQLASGADSLSQGVGALVDGMLVLKHGLNHAAHKLPEPRQLDRLATGAGTLASGSSQLSNATAQLAAGSHRLSEGLNQLSDALPANIPMPQGSPMGLAASVQSTVEMEAAAGNSGRGLAPNIIPGALWLGAGVVVFLQHIRVLPRRALFFSSLAQYLGKLLVPMATVLLQAALLLLVVRYYLDIEAHDPLAFVIVICSSTVVFLLIIFALARAFGDAGKGFAMILLAVQFASSGGLLPVELTGRLYMDISPYLPMTWVVKAMRAAMFGAFEGNWQIPMAMLAGAAVLSILLGATVGRWRFMHPASLRPPVEF